MKALTKVELQDKITQLEKDLAKEQRRYTRFEKQVVSEARQAAEDNGWCDEVDRVLDKMGLGKYLRSEPVIQIWSQGQWVHEYWVSTWTDAQVELERQAFRDRGIRTRLVEVVSATDKVTKVVSTDAYRRPAR